MEQDERRDALLVGRTSTGDAAAFAELFDRHSPTVLGLLLRMVGRRAEAEELLQEVFLQVWQESARYRPDSASPKGWILMLARSRAIDRIRSRDARGRRERATELDDPTRSAAEAPVGPERLEAAERRRQVDDALAELPEEQRQAIVCSFFDGLTHREIAERLGAPLGTIKSRILLGMKKLRLVLDGI